MREKEMAASIVAQYVGANKIPVDQIRHLVNEVYQSVMSMGNGQEPVVSSSQLMCLECGKTFKTLKRHLNEAHGLTPDEYREKHGLGDSPMVAPAYAKVRASISRKRWHGKRKAA